MYQEIMNWIIKTSEYLFKEPWFTVRKDFVELPNGHNIPSYYVLEYPNWVNVIGITKDNQMVVVKQYRHGIGKELYELCAGVIDKEDKSPLEAAQRELLEETGYSGGTWHEWMTVSANPGTHTNLIFCFLAEGLEKVDEQNLESTELLEVELLSIEDCKALLLKGEFLQALHAAPLWKYFAGV
jgi:ADP-ribose pyrophosphatase